jgi:putative membrane protein
MRKSIAILLGICSSTAAWSHGPKPIRTSSITSPSPSQHQHQLFDPAPQLSRVTTSPKKAVTPTSPARPDEIFLASTIASTALVVGTPEMANAATAFTNNAVPSALVAYGHYFSLLGILGCIMVERLTIKPNMTPDEEDLVAGADIGLGLFGVLIAYTGYLRATEYEKGFDFYAHEPLFWLKVAFVGVFGASSFFNTIVIIQRAIAKRNGELVPMGDKLSKRMIQICNAELVAVSVIPLTATFMARGVGYSADFPWQAEAGLAAVVFLGLSFKYVKEALTFEDSNSSIEL